MYSRKWQIMISDALKWYFIDFFVFFLIVERKGHGATKSVTAQRHNTFFKILVLENEIQVSLSLHTNFQAKLTIITIIQRHTVLMKLLLKLILRRDGKLAPSLRILKMLKTTSSTFYFHLYVLTYVLHYGYEYFAGQKVPINLKNYYLFEYKRKY